MIHIQTQFRAQKTAEMFKFYHLKCRDFKSSCRYGVEDLPCETCEHIKGLHVLQLLWVLSNKSDFWLTWNEAKPTVLLLKCCNSVSVSVETEGDPFTCMSLCPCVLVEIMEQICISYSKGQAAAATHVKEGASLRISVSQWQKQLVSASRRHFPSIPPAAVNNHSFHIERLGQPCQIFFWFCHSLAKCNR